MSEASWHGASFRDPSGRIFRARGEIYRAVSPAFAEEYERLISTGLYDDLVSKGCLVAHQEVDASDLAPGSYRVLKPEPVPVISYPWEWSFSQLKDAALLTLDVALSALDHGMVLKDASAFNVQFIGTRPVFIDTLSFETYVEGEPWVAYRQFCQHFLAPLELRAHVHPALASLSRGNLDGVPLDLASALLPAKSKLRPATALHIHAHGRAQQRYADSGSTKRQAGAVSRTSMLGLLDSLRSAINGCRWEPTGTEWADYYAETNYSDCSMSCKTDVVRGFLARVAPSMVWDLGANTARFSRLATSEGAYTVALDVDPAAVEIAYLEGRKTGDEQLLPLVMDLMNPTPALGWALEERESIVNRGRPDVVLALALVHHLAVANNVPLALVAQFLASLAPWLIVEFVPKSDSQVQRMLASRKDIFDGYHRQGFEEAFAQSYEFEAVEPVEECERVLYLMRRRDA